MFFFFNDTATTEIYTLSLHDALPILTARVSPGCGRPLPRQPVAPDGWVSMPCSFMSLTATCCTRDRKSTRLNSSHANISYAVFCLKKKQKTSELRSERFDAHRRTGTC